MAALAGSTWGPIDCDLHVGIFFYRKNPAKPLTRSPWPPSLRARAPTDRTSDPERASLDTIFQDQSWHLQCTRERASQPASMSRHLQASTSMSRHQRAGSSMPVHRCQPASQPPSQPPSQQASKPARRCQLDQQAGIDKRASFLGHQLLPLSVF